MNWFHDLFIEEAKPALERHSGGGVPINNQDKTITQNGTYTADEGFTGLGTVKVSVAREDQTDIEDVLNGVIARSFSEILLNAPKIGNYTFTSYSNLTKADFPAATIIGSYAFKSCANLTAVNFPVATNIYNSAFESCNSLTTVKFPAVTSIGNQAFYYCLKLTTADFPAVTSIGKSSFNACSALTTLILRSETMCTKPGTSAFESTPIKSGTGYIYVPRALVDSYKAASGWSTYANQFRALEDYTVDGTITGELDSTKI